MGPKPPTITDLTWLGELKFSATVNNHTLALDSAGKAAPTPVETLAISLAGCMAIDLAHILTKGRQPLTGLRARLVAERAPDDPHRFTRITLAFVVEGGAPREAVERAIELSRDKYCSVWHSMRHDIDFQVSCEVR